MGGHQGAAGASSGGRNPAEQHPIPIHPLGAPWPPRSINRTRRDRQQSPKRSVRIPPAGAAVLQADGARAGRATAHTGARRRCPGERAHRARCAHFGARTFQLESNVYLGLRAIFWQLARAKSDDQLRDVLPRMWDMAVHLEDGSVSDGEQALRAAEEALRQALEHGASDEEIKQLTDQLRAALDKFLQALAEQMRKNPQQLARPLDPNARQIRPQDLRNMIDRLEQMARSGARDAARRRQDLQQMLENLQMARPGQQMDDGDDDMMSALDELGDMIRKQQQLRDRTFQQGQ